MILNNRLISAIRGYGV